MTRTERSLAFTRGDKVIVAAGYASGSSWYCGELSLMSNDRRGAGYGAGKMFSRRCLVLRIRIFTDTRQMHLVLLYLVELLALRPWQDMQKIMDII